MADTIKFCKSCNSVREDNFAFCPTCGSTLDEFVQNSDVSQDTSVLDEGLVSELIESDRAAGQTTRLGETVEPDDVREVEGRAEENVDDAVEGHGTTVHTRTEIEPADLSLTIVDDGPSGTRKSLMILAAFLVIGFGVGSWFISLFGIANEVDFLDGELVVAAQILEDDIVAQLEEENTPKKNKGEREGGGGGGREEETPPSKGRLVTQSPKPLFPPSPNFEQAKTSLPIIQSTEGDTERPITNQRAGIPTSLSEDPSSGPGRGGGIGTGIGPSQGGGVGTSLGNRRGIGGCPNPPCGGDDDAPSIRRGETVGVRILAQPRASYTDAARQAGIQGKVVLRVTFQSDGSIGAISAVSGLPNGLTERAIAAARSIRFEPAKRNGVPYSVTRTIEYSFTIY